MNHNNEVRRRVSQSSSRPEYLINSWQAFQKGAGAHLIIPLMSASVCNSDFEFSFVHFQYFAAERFISMADNDCSSSYVISFELLMTSKICVNIKKTFLRDIIFMIFVCIWNTTHPQP